MVQGLVGPKVDFQISNISSLVASSATSTLRSVSSAISVRSTGTIVVSPLSSAFLAASAASQVQVLDQLGLHKVVKLRENENSQVVTL